VRTATLVKVALLLALAGVLAQVSSASSVDSWTISSNPVWSHEGNIGWPGGRSIRPGIGSRSEANPGSSAAIEPFLHERELHLVVQLTRDELSA
jgi:hypothetical protein